LICNDIIIIIVIICMIATGRHCWVKLCVCFADSCTVGWV